MDNTDLKYIQKDVKEWAERAIPVFNWDGLVNHLRSEVEELDQEKLDGDKEKIGKELADICILAMHLAGKLEIDLCDHIIEKMKINKKRKWSEADPITGMIRHVE